jgi:branched-chain amino acid transport system substrate-binding protein
LTFQAQGKAALEIIVTGVYLSELDNAENQRFVKAFRSKYNRDPATYAAHQYDAIMLLDAAVREVKGDLKDASAVRAAIRKAAFKSVRGPFAFNQNHMPIQNTYVAQVAERGDGALYLKPLGTVVQGAKDQYFSKCEMK